MLVSNTKPLAREREEYPILHSLGRIQLPSSAGEVHNHMYWSGQQAGLNHGDLILAEVNLTIFHQTAKLPNKKKN